MYKVVSFVDHFWVVKDEVIIYMSIENEKGVDWKIGDVIRDLGFVKMSIQEALENETIGNEVAEFLNNYPELFV
jgi:hypothetical protein